MLGTYCQWGDLQRSNIADFPYAYTKCPFCFVAPCLPGCPAWCSNIYETPSEFSWFSGPFEETSFRFILKHVNIPEDNLIYLSKRRFPRRRMTDGRLDVVVYMGTSAGLWISRSTGFGDPLVELNRSGQRGRQKSGRKVGNRESGRLGRIAPTTPWR